MAIALALLLNVRGGLDLWICPDTHVLKVEAGPRWRFVSSFGGRVMAPPI